MVEEIIHPDGRIEHPSVRYERSDANFRSILFVILGALVFGAIVECGILVFFNRYAAYQTEVKKSAHPLAPGPSTALPRAPRLEQVDRLAGMETANSGAGERAKRELLNSYGPTKEDGFVHIPIDRAMKYLVEEGKLPARPEPPADGGRRSNGLIDAGESNSGRVFKGGPK